MYLRTVRATTKDGPAEYVQLCHNHYDPRKKGSKTQVLYNFGRADQLDLDALRRLVKSISRFLEPHEVEQLQEQLGEDWPFEFLGARDLGGTWLLDGLWKRLRIDETLQRLLAQRGYQTPVERLLFALVANRALAPSSKLAMESWVANEVFIEGLPQVEVHRLYRAMDFLLEAAEEIQREVFFSVASLFNLEVDLIFLDTTSTYFEIEGEDPDTAEEAGLRKRGVSKDKRQDLAQVVIGFAMTRTGIPVRCWVWPGNTVDQEVVEQVKRDLNGWRLNRVIWVADTGFNSHTNRRIFQGAGGHYILGEKLRLGAQGELAEALRRRGRYRKLEDGLEIKEVILGGDSAVRRRFVVVHNPEEAERDRAGREEIVAEVERQLEALKQLEGEPHEKRACELRAHRVYGRYIRQTPTGKLRLNKGKIRREERLDGKFLVSSSDDELGAEEVATGYKQLWRIERLNRGLKHVVEVRPVYHRLEERIRAHVLLCWLGLLLICVAENETGETWFGLKQKLKPLQMGIHRTRSGEVWQTSPVSEEQKDLCKRLKVKLPPRYYRLPAPKSSGA
jgi:transposase